MNTTVNRREFLGRAAVVPAAAAAIGLGAATLAAAQTPIRRVAGAKLKLSLNAYSFSKALNDQIKGRGKGMSLFDLLDYCAQQDFDAIDPTGYFFPGYPKVPAERFLNDFKRRAFQLGLDISGTGVRNNFATPDKSARAKDVQHVKEWVEVAARMGAPVLRVFADTQMRAETWQSVSKGATRDEVEKWLADDIRECADHAAKYGVVIGVQNHGDFLKTADNLISLLSRVNSPWCGAIVDTGYFKATDPYAEMAKAAPYAVNWQIKQSPEGVENEAVAPTDLKRLMKIIRDSGYRGYLPIETLSPRGGGGNYDPYKVVPAFLAQLRDAIAESA